MDQDTVISLRAGDLARVVYDFTAAGVNGTYKAAFETAFKAGVQTGAEAIAASKRTRKDVLRDERGQIVSVIEGPAL